MEALRRDLSSSGKYLEFTDKGLGTDIKVSGEIDGRAAFLDLESGPRASILSWEPMWANKAARVIWECIFTIDECQTGAETDGGVTEFNYSLNWDFDGNGLLTRTIQGSLEVEQHLVGGIISSTADTYRNRLRFDVPRGFKRTSHSYTTTQDKRTLQFTFTDSEDASDIAHYSGISSEDITETIQSVNATRTIVADQWDITISGSIQVAKGFPRYNAWLAFATIVKSRRAAAKAALVHRGDDNHSENQPGTKKQVALNTTNVTITEEIFGRGMTFSVSWRLYSGLSTLFEASGLWTDVTESRDWDTWKGSMLGNATTAGPWNPSRHIGLSSGNGAKDSLLGICESRDSFPTLSDQTTSPNDHQKIAPLLGSECPPKEQSWISFEPITELICNTGQVTHKLVGGKSNYQTTALTPGSDTASMLSDSPTGVPPLKTQARHRASYKVHFSGKAVRMGFKIPQPVLIKYGNQVATLEGELKFREKRVALADGCHMWAATWEGLYILSEPPQDAVAEISPNPKEFNQL